MLNPLIIAGGKLLSRAVRTANLGNGSTWPGHLALKLNRHFVKDMIRNSSTKVIIVAGTNGKTTTSKLITTILEGSGQSVLQNVSGANLLNGLASAIVLNSSVGGKIDKDYAVFEVDENALPHVLKELTPDYLVLINLFRDQLDRYGEVHTIVTKWKEAIALLPEKTTLILNSDDPQISFLSTTGKAKVTFFGVTSMKKNTKLLEHAVDSIYCPRCGEKLEYTSVTFSHLGKWKCNHCTLKHAETDLVSAPYYPLPGMYNQYNTNAAVLTAATLGIDEQTIANSLQSFTPAFGRQEQLVLKGRVIRIFLSKNPTGFNESLRTSKELGAKHILFVLNDRIPDGKDVSWIWDTDIENILDGKENVYAAGDRAYDMAVRLKYAHPVVKHVDTYFPSLEKGLTSALQNTPEGETLFILPTYTAMLEIRQLITGKKIL